MASTIEATPMKRGGIIVFAASGTFAAIALCSPARADGVTITAPIEVGGFLTLCGRLTTQVLQISERSHPYDAYFLNLPAPARFHDPDQGHDWTRHDGAYSRLQVGMPANETALAKGLVGRLVTIKGQVVTGVTLYWVTPYTVLGDSI